MGLDLVASLDSTSAFSCLACVWVLSPEVALPQGYSSAYMVKVI